MPFKTPRIQIDGSLNVDGSIYQFNELFESGTGGAGVGDVRWANGTDGANSYIVTAAGDGSIVAEPNFKYDGTTFWVGVGDACIAGDVSIGGKLGVSGNIFGSNLSGTNTGDQSDGSIWVIGNTNNRILTATGTGGLNGEAGLTFASNILKGVDTLTITTADGGSPTLGLVLTTGAGSSGNDGITIAPGVGGGGFGGDVSIKGSTGADNGGSIFINAGIQNGPPGHPDGSIYIGTQDTSAIVLGTDKNIPVGVVSGNEFLFIDTGSGNRLKRDTAVTSVGTNAPLTGTVTTSGNLSITQSATGADGYLSSTDWNTFNDKVDGSIWVTNNTNNRVLTATGTGAINGEANLLFSSNTLSSPSTENLTILTASGGSETGNLELLTGGGGSARSGSITIATGSGGAQWSGDISIHAGSVSTTYAPGDIYIKAGAGGGGYDIGGNVYIDGGAGATDGSVYIGSVSAKGIVIGNSTVIPTGSAAANEFLFIDTGSGNQLKRDSAVTSVGTNAPLTGTVTTTGSLSITQATTSTDGYLSQTDWDTFNDKATSDGSIWVTNNSNNRVLTATGGNSINGESNLTFSGSILGVTGSIAVDQIDLNGSKIAGTTTTALEVTGYSPGGGTAGNILLRGGDAQIGGTVTIRAGSGLTGVDVSIFAGSATSGDPGDLYLDAGLQTNEFQNGKIYIATQDASCIIFGLPAIPTGTATTNETLFIDTGDGNRLKRGTPVSTGITYTYTGTQYSDSILTYSSAITASPESGLKYNGSKLSTSGDVSINGFTNTGGTLRIQGIDAPAAGEGMEMYYNGGVGTILSYDRDAGPQYRELRLRGSKVQLGISDAPKTGGRTGLEIDDASCMFNGSGLNMDYSWIKNGGSAYWMKYDSGADTTWMSRASLAEFAPHADASIIVVDSTGQLKKTTAAGGGGMSWTSGGTNRVGTYGSASTIVGEANLTFDGNILEFGNAADKTIRMKSSSASAVKTLYIRGAEATGNSTTGQPTTYNYEGYVGGDVAIYGGQGADMPTSYNSLTSPYTYNDAGDGGDLILYAGQPGAGGDPFESKFPGSVTVSGFNITLNSTGISGSNGNVYVNYRLTHLGDTDTYMEFSDNVIRFHAGSISYDKMAIGTTGVIFNEDGRPDYDFRIESDACTHIFFVDAGANAVGVGTATPKCMLDVRGTIRATEAQIVPTSGKGLELIHNNTQGYIFPYDRDVGGYQRLNIRGNLIAFGAANGTSFRSAIDVSYGEVVINEGAVNMDFRVEDEGANDYAFFVRGDGPPKIGMGECINETEATYKMLNLRFYEDNDAAKLTSVAMQASNDSMFIYNDWTSLGHASIDFKCDTDYIDGYNCGRFGFMGQGGTSSTTVNYWFWTGGVSTTAQQETMRLLRSGVLHARSDIVAYSTTITSDERLKKNIENLEDDTLDKIMQLRPVTFEWKDKSKRGDTRVSGLIAQEVEEIFPELISKWTNLDDALEEGEEKDETEYKHIRYNELIPYLTKGMQKQQEIIDSQEERIQKLEEQLNKLLG